MYGIFLKSMALMVSLMFLALTIATGQVDSAFIDFTKLSAEQIYLFKYAFFVGFVSFLLLVPYIGDEI